MIDAIERHIVEWNRLGRAFVLRLESIANFLRAYIVIWASFDDLFLIDRYAIFTNPFFPKLQIHSLDLQLHKVSQIHTYFRP